MRKLKGSFTTLVVATVGTLICQLPLRAQEMPRLTGESMMAQTDEEGEVQRSETIDNPNPLFLPEQLPGFSMQESRIERNFYSNGSKDMIHEIWVKPATDAALDPIFVKLTLYLEKNRNKAIKTASGVYLATLEPNQAPMIGKPFPGSYSGESIGDYCWHPKAGFKIAGTNTPIAPVSSSLVVVEKDNCFRLLLTGPVDGGPGGRDRDAERLAKKIVHRLKTWTRPQ